MEWFGLDSSRREDLVSYAGYLKGGDVPGKFFPDELKGMGGNDVCEWEKKKAFENLHLHGISFESVSSLFRDPLPSGYRILFDGVDPSGSGQERSWGRDERSFVVAMSPSGKLYVAEVDREHTNSRKVRLITAYVITEQKAAQLAQDEDVWSGVDIFASLARYVEKVPTEFGEPVKLRLLRGVLSRDGAVEELMSDYGCVVGEARSLVLRWVRGRRL
jgi:uncharacterized DUF497 family protein